MNCAEIMGRLTADPELRSTQSGTPVTSFTVAVPRKYVSQGQERQTDFIEVQAWRGTAEFICKYFGKGKMIALDGAIETGNYTDKEGVKRKTVRIVANNVYFCGEKSDARETRDEDDVRKKMQDPTEEDFSEVEDDGDLPF